VILIIYIHICLFQLIGIDYEECKNHPPPSYELPRIGEAMMKIGTRKNQKLLLD
jgi:hypothetical protein